MSRLNESLSRLLVQNPVVGGVVMTGLGCFIAYSERDKPNGMVWLGVAFIVGGIVTSLFGERMFANSRHRRR